MGERERKKRENNLELKPFGIFDFDTTLAMGFNVI